MKFNSKNRKRAAVYILGLFNVGLAAAAMVACSNQTDSEDATVTAAPAPSGAQLWAENCSRCHNFRDPSSFSDKQWEIIGMHMRTRANLTGDDYRSIVEFLKSSN